MSRRRKPAEEGGRGHSAIENGWFLPNARAVVKVEEYAGKLWQKIKDEPTLNESEQKVAGRIEGMAIALAILKGDGYTAKGELERIKNGRAG
ncbi:hypothetical protein SEA_AZIRA_61 [Gordonia phage Azira]|uniref:Uncharacterized protein n=1 Tax=Gordonia phage Azira TaxID=3035369 RepID=A0AAF0K0F0_9CAUD|nr:hypothetical protein QLQ73_gp61 [Gordonia phage Azira]WGH21067.1 hypothetical protein SEA_AZIRA_61 [Gordonia phage Azira]